MYLLVLGIGGAEDWVGGFGIGKGIRNVQVSTTLVPGSHLY